MKSAFLMFVFLALIFSTISLAQQHSEDKIAMKRYLVERSFPDGLEIPINQEGCDMVMGVVSNNTEDQVTWIHSYVSSDKKKSFCIYDAPSMEAILEAAKKNNIPVDKIIEVTVLDPYFYH
jgi:c-di-AMP phosphodiesterase-like protein